MWRSFGGAEDNEALADLTNTYAMNWLLKGSLADDDHFPEPRIERELNHSLSGTLDNKTLIRGSLVKRAMQEMQLKLPNSTV